eukprot:s397_g33.t1
MLAKSTHDDGKPIRHLLNVGTGVPRYDKDFEGNAGSERTKSEADDKTPRRVLPEIGRPTPERIVFLADDGLPSFSMSKTEEGTSNHAKPTKDAAMPR